MNVERSSPASRPPYPLLYLRSQVSGSRFQVSGSTLNFSHLGYLYAFGLAAYLLYAGRLQPPRRRRD